MLYDFMGVVTLLVFVVAAVVGADRAWRFLSRKRELRASDLRGSGGHRKPPLGEKRAVRWDVLNKAKLAIEIRELGRSLERASSAAVEQIPHARDPFAAWDGKQFVPNDGVVMVPRSHGATSYVPSPKAPQVPANPMFDWRGTGGARGDMPQEWVDRVTEAGLVATNPVDVRRQAAESGIRFNSQTGRGERIRETGPEAKWVP